MDAAGQSSLSRIGPGNSSEISDEKQVDKSGELIFRSAAERWLAVGADDLQLQHQKEASNSIHHVESGHAQLEGDQLECILGKLLTANEGVSKQKTIDVGVGAQCTNGIGDESGESDVEAFGAQCTSGTTDESAESDLAGFASQAEIQQYMFWQAQDFMCGDAWLQSQAYFDYGEPVDGSATYKKKFCAFFSRTMECPRGDRCLFAHSREELSTPLLLEAEEQLVESAMTEEFFMYKFKTLWCPIGFHHDWQACVYAHNYQDARRKPSIGYGTAPCPHWNKSDTGLDYVQRCPFGLRCPRAHGAKEQLYHPDFFRTKRCRDLQQKRPCPRKTFCAFHHSSADKRHSDCFIVDYQSPLPEENFDEAWIVDFLSPPFAPGDTGDIQEWPHTSTSQVFPPPNYQAWARLQETTISGKENLGEHAPGTPTTDVDSDCDDRLECAQGKKFTNWTEQQTESKHANGKSSHWHTWGYERQNKNYQWSHWSRARGDDSWKHEDSRARHRRHRR